MTVDLSSIERKHGTSATLRACRDFIRSHKKEKGALLQIARGKAPRASNRKSTYLRTRRECDKAFSAMIKRQRGTMRCQIHCSAGLELIPLPVKCSGHLQVFHIISKSESECLRYDPENVLIACSGANKHESYHRVEWRAIFDKMVPERMARLREKAKWKCKRNEASLKQMIVEFNKR